MKKINALLLFILSLGMLPSVQAQTTGTVADIRFISGHWKAAMADGRTVEAYWLAPDAGNITGLFRMVKAGKVTMYEILAYEQTSQGLVSLVKHFNPGLIAQEEKEVSDRYNFLEAGKNSALFEKQDGSLRILYEMKGANQLVLSRGTLQEGKWVFKSLFDFARLK
jgi:hypothetical protein